LGQKEAAQAAYVSAQKMIDKSISKGIVHKNKGARLKSRLHARLKLM
jgi:small subunit ribosomal protein S20